MKLLTWGNGIIPQTWEVAQTVPSGYARCYYIIQGQVSYQQGETVQLLQPGALYLLPTATPYALKCAGKQPLQILWFHFDLSPYLMVALQKIPASQASQELHLLYLLLQELEKEEFDVTVRELSLSLLELFFVRSGLLQQAQPPFDEILAYIHQSLSDPLLSVSVLSERLGYTQEHFIRQFSKVVGTTPYRYILMQRMAQARVLLLKKTPVKEIAKQVGYENARVFSFAFRNCFGVAPSQFERYYQPIV